MCKSTDKPTNLSLSRMMSRKHTHEWVMSHLIEACHVCTSTVERTNLCLSRMLSRTHTHEWVMSHLIESWHVCISTDERTNLSFHQNASHTDLNICISTDMCIQWTYMYMRWHVHALTCISTGYTCLCIYMYMQWTYMYIRWRIKQSLLVTYDVTHAYPWMSHVTFNWVMSRMYIHWRTNQSLLTPELQPHRPDYMYIHSHVYPLDIHIYAVHIHVYALTCICSAYTCISTDEWTNLSLSRMMSRTHTYERVMSHLIESCHIQLSHITYIYPLTNQPVSPCHVWCHAHIPMNESCHI